MAAKKRHKHPNVTPKKKQKKNRLLYFLAPAVLCLGLVVFALLSPKVEIPFVTARSVLILDADSGRTLYEDNSDFPFSPASLTKLMTALLIFEDLESGKLSLSDTYTVTLEDTEVPGSKYGLLPGQQVTVEQLLAGMLLSSGCDCVQALINLAEETTESFVERMNTKAAELGMDGTHFLNATGIDSNGHFMTAKDIGKLAVTLVKQYPQVLDYTSRSILEIDGLVFRSTHQLVGLDERVLGLKTGTTSIGGNNLVTYASYDGKNRIIVLLQSDSETSRFYETTDILNALYGGDEHDG